MIQLLDQVKADKLFKTEDSFVVTTERSQRTSPQAVVNIFKRWHYYISFLGCSSYGGRRTFIIVNAAKKVSLVGGILKDVQLFVRHHNMSATQLYSESYIRAMIKLVDMAKDLRDLYLVSSVFMKFAFLSLQLE